MGVVITVEREYEFSDAHFQLLRKLAGEHTGIDLSDAKRELMYSRLSRRVRQLGMNSFGDYCNLVIESGEELTNFINAITTNLTSFFREKHHFDFLGAKLLPKILQDNAHHRKIRIWSTACSTGEEPYSIAMVLGETIPKIEQWDIKILATDIDSNVLAKAQAGIYGQAVIENLSMERRKRWFRQGKGNKQGLAKVIPDLQALITFKQLNLMHTWPMHGLFDLIFCRNVVIYFDQSTQRILFNRLADVLRTNGHLFIGHSETLYKISDRFDLLGKTIYQRCS